MGAALVDPLLSQSGSAFPWLSAIVLLPLVAALILPLLPGDRVAAPRAIAVSALTADLVLMALVFSRHFVGGNSGLQLVERISWIPAIELEWSLAADGVSAPLVVLSGLVTLLAAMASWPLARKPRLYYGLVLVQASAQAMVFLAQDFLLFFLAWELELVPVY
ncbi:MAG TPA: NAD(P)H-quinone oxidoreductase subunit 4, partial [Synechococcus sp. UBA8638]|nr:NAD(P)H-quinone oxidoreductase subunit 4 [Synechococcus sp. UBA8638]